MEVVVSPVRLTFSVNAINSVAVAANWLYLTGGPTSVVCINLDEPSQVRDIALPRKLAEAAGFITQIYVDGTGSTLLAVTSKNEHFFCHNQKQTEFKPLPKLKGMSTICAAFHPLKSNVFLLGTRAGNIVEVGIDSAANETYFKRDLKFAATIWKSPNKEAVTSLLVTLDARKQTQVLATCGKSLLQWSRGGDSGNSGEPSMEAADSRFQALLGLPPQTLLTGKSLQNLVVSPNREHLGVLTSHHTIGLADIKDIGSDMPQFTEVRCEGRIERLLLSDYYALALVRGSLGPEMNINAINLFANDQNKIFSAPGLTQVTGFSVDAREKTFWAYNEDALMELKLENETSGMWQSLANQRRFTEAMSLTETRAQRSQVLVMHGDYEFSQKNYQRAGELFGLSDAPLEVRALQLIRDVDNSKAALIALLTARLKHTESAAQQTMLTAWLASLDNLSWIELPKVKWDVDTICQILKQRGHFDKLVPILVNVGDIEHAVTILVRNEHYSDALDLLRQYEHIPSVLKYAQPLLDHEPRATVESWMRISNLPAEPLLPCLLRYAQQFRGPITENQALRYLRFAIKQPQGSLKPLFDATTAILAASLNPAPISSISPLNSSLSVKSSSSTKSTSSARHTTSADDENDEETLLLDFLKQYAPQVDDHDFALRICVQYKHIKSAVYIATIMGLYEDAVQLCLKSSDIKMYEYAVEIADKQTLSGPEGANSNSEELRRILLREIAHKFIEVQGAPTAVRFAKLLRVDDLLAQFPNFETLNELAPEIVKSLEQTNSRLSALDAEINESLLASENMQRELREFKKKPVLIQPGESCYLCGFPLLTRKFVVFPCQHGFHVDCVKRSHPGAPVSEECVLCSVDNIRQIEMPLNNTF